MLRPFHLSIPVDSIEKCRPFYSNLLEFEEGRSSDTWVDYNFFGHQLVMHQVPNYIAPEVANPVDSKEVPVPHFGVVLTMEDFWTFADLVKSKGIQFVIEPYTRFKGQPGEQATMFFKDPSGNALEFKAFNDLSSLFDK